jgi:hypothetical protein
MFFLVRACGVAADVGFGHAVSWLRGVASKLSVQLRA